MKFFLKKRFSFFILIFLFLPRIVWAREDVLFLEPVVQGYALEELIPVIEEKEHFYIDFYRLASILKAKVERVYPIQGYFLKHSFLIDFSALSSDEYLSIDGTPYFSTKYYEKLWQIQIKVLPKDMQLIISSEEKLPTTILIESEQRQRHVYEPERSDSFSEYTFDNRFWSFPIIDVSLQKGFQFQGKQSDELSSQFNTSTGYEFDFGMLFGGMDLYGSLFGDDATYHYDPRARLTLGRTLLEEPKNPFNLTTFEMGDVNGINSTLFNTSGSGRGVTASSSKDLVLSADKTIDLSGPLSEGWQVELYQNGQLIGFRRSGTAGQYLFSNVPVVYGLNEFRLVFYGPYGEIQEQTERYYSGTSPVKKGKFGYYFNAYQKDHYLFEKNEPFIGESFKETLDLNTYYGVTDRLSVMAGYSTTPNVMTNMKQDFAQTGFQYALSGFSVQYNLLYGSENQAIGHHADIQGNIYIGDILARYEYYGKLNSPISYINGNYLKDLKEIRLFGVLHSIGAVPYFLDYTEGNGNFGNSYKQFQARLSPNFARYYNLTLENTWNKDKERENDILSFLFQAQFDKLGFYTQAQYQIKPKNCFYNVSQQVNYRLSKYTYLQGGWNHNFRSKYSVETQNDLDVFTLSAGRVFDFGNLTLGLSTDTDKNSRIMLTYQMSFGKVPNQIKGFSNPYNPMGQRSAIYARVEDEKGMPLPDTALRMSGYTEQLITNSEGEILIPDLTPYEKGNLIVEEENLPDISLTPEKEMYKLVLRPGTVYPLKIVCTHKGSLEGLIETPQNPSLYHLDMVDSKGQVFETKIPEDDGSFIFDGIPYGRYHLLIKNGDDKVLGDYPLDIDKPFTEINTLIQLMEEE